MTDRIRLARLFEPLKIGPVELRNRIVFPPMVTGYGTAEGKPTQRSVDYYAERSRGGAGLIIVEASAVEPITASPIELRFCADDYVESFTQLAAGIHAGGAKAIVQLVHSGGIALSYEGLPQPIGPSSFQIPMPGAPVAREMTVAEIEGVVRSFVQTAGRAETAGFDGIELHAAHGYLLCQFLSPLTNRRQDAFGGDVERRAKFVVEVIQTIKARTSKGFLVGCRISGDEYAEGGLTLDMAVETAQILERAGVDYLSISAGSWWAKTPYAMPPIFLRQGYMVYLADRIKQTVNVPVMTAGRIKSPRMAEDILSEGRADLVGMGRALLADPELPNKALQGRLSEIRPCIACNIGCFDRATFGMKDLKCAVNPTVGRPELGLLEQTREPKKVLVIGGGPAGMTAAIVAAKRGHSVALWERRGTPGGQVTIAALPPSKEEFLDIVEHLWREALRAGVDVRLNQTADLAAVRDFGPDIVILATGSKPERPSIHGVDGPNVITASEVLYSRAHGVGQKVVVVGGGEVGCETASFLAWLGKQVTVLKRGPKMADDMGILARSMLLGGLRDAGVEMLTGVAYKQIAADRITITVQGEERALACDTVVLAAGSKPDNQLEEALRSLGCQVIPVGEAVRVGNVLDAVESAWIAAREM